MIKKGFRILISVFLLLFAEAGLLAVRTQQPIRLYGEIAWDGTQSHATPDHMPGFHIYFAGKHMTSDHNGLYQVTVYNEDTRFLDDLSFIICKSFDVQREQGNTIAGLTIDKVEKCSWYKLDREYDEKNKLYYWKMNERTDLKAGESLPSNAVVILISGSRVVKIEDTQRQMDGYTVLPRIVLHCDAEKTTRAAIKSEIGNISARKISEDCQRTIRKDRAAGVEIAL